MGTEEVKKSNKPRQNIKDKSCCNKSKCKSKSQNGKVDAPRNIQSNKFRKNYDNINWGDEYYYDRFINTK